MGDRGHVLRDDGASVEIFGHVVTGGADELHAPIVGLLIGLGTGKGG